MYPYTRFLSATSMQWPIINFMMSFLRATNLARMRWRMVHTVAHLLNLRSLHGHEEVEKELDANIEFQLLHNKLIGDNNGEQQATGNTLSED